MKLHEAEAFVDLFYCETGGTEVDRDIRLEEIRQQFAETNKYWQTTEELVFAARVGWRNSNKCIGRLFWQSLQVLDERLVLEETQIFEKLLYHIQYATNRGRIRPTITVFHPTRVRIWNHQLIRYAGYETEQGIIGDSSSIEFTKVCKELGWKGAGGEFDVLPLVIQVDEHVPRFFEIPNDYVLEVPIRHSEFKTIGNLDLKWYAVPIISCMKLNGGGVEYQAAPFNGWYMGTEIGARNFADVERYNMLPAVAKAIGLDTSSNMTLWKDRALVELNIAVLHSFKEDGVSIVDHHTASQQFQLFEQQESVASREVKGNWAWLVPPMSGATSHVFHKPYHNQYMIPNYFYQKNPY